MENPKTPVLATATRGAFSRPCNHPTSSPGWLAPHRGNDAARWNSRLPCGVFTKRECGGATSWSCRRDWPVSRSWMTPVATQASSGGRGSATRSSARRGWASSSSMGWVAHRMRGGSGSGLCGTGPYKRGPCEERRNAGGVSGFSRTSRARSVRRCSNCPALFVPATGGSSPKRAPWGLQPASRGNFKSRSAAGRWANS